MENKFNFSVLCKTKEQVDVDTVESVTDKINVAELLKDCPKGMELDCSVFEDVTLYMIDTDTENDYPIRIKTTKNDYFLDLTKYGTYSNVEEAKCVIFPKGKTTWEGFHRPFKDGDIVTWEDRGSLVAFIYKERKDVAVVKHHFALYAGSLGTVVNGEIFLVESEIVFATEEEKQKLLKAIEESGYKWDSENKILEKLTESNEDVNDEIVMSGIYFDREYYADEVELHLGNYEIEIRNGRTYAIFKKSKTEILKPKFNIGDKIKHKDTILTIINVQMNSYIVEDEPDNFGILSFSQQDNWDLIHSNEI